MRSVLIVIAIFLCACVSEPLPDGFKDSDDFDPIVAAKNRISLGLTYLQNGNFTQAKFNLDKALQFAPRLADAHFSIAYYYQQVDEIELADAAYQRALDFDSNNPDIANTYGAFLCANGQYEKAKRYFLKAINNKNYINTAESYENLALCSQSQGQIDDALNYLQSAINHQPSRGKSIMLLVELQMQQAMWEQARQNLRRYERVARITPDSLLKSIKIEQALNNATLAKGYGDMLIRMYPSDPRTIEYLTSLRNTSGVDANGKLNKQLKPTAPVGNYTPTPTPPSPAQPAVTSDKPALVKRREQTVEKVADEVADVQKQMAASSETQQSSLVAAAPQLNTQDTDDEPGLVEAAIASQDDEGQQPQQSEEQAVQEEPVSQALIEDAEQMLPDDSASATGDVQAQLQQQAERPVDDELAELTQSPEQNPEKSSEKSAEQSPENSQTEPPADTVETVLTEAQKADEAPIEDITELAESSAAEQSDATTTSSETSYHVVEKGENLYRISLRYNVKMRTLMEWNELQEGQGIMVGQRLIVVDPATVDE